jgi:hypothetical protein
MNAKKAKALRKFLRATGIDFRESRYNWKVLVEGDKQIPINRLLHPESGRSVYKRLKPLWA